MNWQRGCFLTGVGGIAGALLLCELTLTRIFSVTMWYHMAFLAISLALIGLAAAGVTVYLFPRRFSPDRLIPHVSWLSAALAAAIVGCGWLLTVIPYRNEVSAAGFLKLSAIYLCAAVPFYLGGLILSLIMTHRAEEISKIYFADLCGASVGCLALIPGLEALGAPSLLLLAAAFVLASGALFALSADQGRISAALAAGAGAAVALMALNVVLPWFTIHYVKGEKQEDILFDRWNSFSRVTVTDPGRDNPVPQVFTMGLSPVYQGPVPEQKFITIDGVAGTPLTRFDLDFNKLPYLFYEVTSLAYHLRDEPSVLIIGPGGGEDVLAALSVSRARRIVGVEINPLMEEIAQEAFAEFTGRPYSLPGVELHIDEGRSYTSRSSEEFDIIQASMVDTWAATSAGAYTLTENNLYTVEAFHQFWEHLTPDGIFTMSRFIFEPPRQTLRVVSLCLEVMNGMGITDPGAHLMIISEPLQHVATVLWKRSPFAPGEVRQLVEFSKNSQFNVIYAPGETGHPVFAQFIDGPDRAGFIDSYWFDVSAPTDNKPFFFHMIKPRHIMSILSIEDDGQRFNYVAVFVLASLLLTVSLLLCAVILIPLAVRRKAGVLRGWKRLRFVLYFACLGLAFMLIEITLIQKFILFLGHPTYSLTVILFSLLLFSGIGSNLTARIPFGRERKAIKLIVGVLLVILVLQQSVLTRFITANLDLPLVWRILATVLFLAPAALLMGMPFPLGIRVLREHDRGLIPWGYGVNGAASVLASIAVVFIAMNAGFVAAMGVGDVIYLLALLLI